MRNLRSYSENSTDYFDKIVESKRNSTTDPEYKERIVSYKPVIDKQFINYDQNFINNELQLLECHGFKDISKIDLSKLYSYRNSNIQKLKIEVTTLENNRVLNTCQNCTINEVNTLDHFVNKGEFPEFSVHPKNLHPSCSVCNSYKGDNWREDGEVIFLNLYIDKLPNKQYLFVELEFENDIIYPKFFIDNRNNLPDKTFSKIENHYNKLFLCERFRTNSYSVITSLQNTLITYSKKLTIKDLRELVQETAFNNMSHFGENYWKSILEIAIVDSDEAIEFLIS